MTRFYILIICLAPAVFVVSCGASKQQASAKYVYTIDDQRLYDTIVKLDSTLFYYYNTCDVNFDKHAAFYSDSIEFYHDKGGLSTNKADVIGGIKKYVCGRVTRELISGSIEVYPIPNFGAIEMGLHQFRNKEEPDAKPHASRFMIVWQYTKEAGWKIRKVISLH
jgi:hypothetical protein